MFNIGDKIDYGFYSNVKIVGEDEHHYILEDKNGNTKKVFKSLIEKYGKQARGSINGVI